MAVDQRRLVDHHREALAVLAHEQRLEAFARRVVVGPVYGQPRGLALQVAIGVLGRPVGRAGAAEQLVGGKADHRAEGRVDVGDAPLAVACAQSGDQRILHRLAEGQRLGQRRLGARPPADVARQQQHQREQRHRQAQHQRGGQVGNQARRPGHAVHAQAQGAARQVDQAVGAVHAQAAAHAAARQPRAVAFDEGQLVAPLLLGRQGAGQQRLQRQRGHQEALVARAGLQRQAQVDDLQAGAAAERHEVAAGKDRRADAPRRGAGGGGVGVELAAGQRGEQRRARGRVDVRRHAPVGFAPLDAQHRALLQQQFSRHGAPALGLRRLRAELLQVLLRTQQRAAHLRCGLGGERVHLVLGAPGLVAHRQHHQQAQRDQQQQEQRAPQQHAAACPGHGRCREGGDGGLHGVGGNRPGAVCAAAVRRRYAVSRMARCCGGCTLPPRGRVR